MAKAIFDAEPQTYKYGLKFTNNPKYHPTRGEDLSTVAEKKKKSCYFQLKIIRLQRQYNILYWFFIGLFQSDIELIDRFHVPNIFYKVEAGPDWVKCEGIHHPLLEIHYYQQFLYVLTSPNVL